MNSGYRRSQDLPAHNRLSVLGWHHTRLLMPFSIRYRHILSPPSRLAQPVVLPGLQDFHFDRSDPHLPAGECMDETGVAYRGAEGCDRGSGARCRGRCDQVIRQPPSLSPCAGAALSSLSPTRAAVLFQRQRRRRLKKGRNLLTASIQPGVRLAAAMGNS